LAKESFGKIRLHFIRFLNELSVILPRKTIFVLTISVIPNSNGSTEYRISLTLAFQNGVKGLNSGLRGNGSQTTGFYGDAELLGDDLYSRQPMAESVRKHNFNLIWVCLPTSHPALYEWLSFLETNGEVKTTQQQHWNGCYFEIWDYRYIQYHLLHSELGIADRG
jgi:hypothetical protein